MGESLYSSSEDEMDWPPEISSQVATIEIGIGEGQGQELTPSLFDGSDESEEQLPISLDPPKSKSLLTAAPPRIGEQPQTAIDKELMGKSFCSKSDESPTCEKEE